jgi:2-methylcitrate dehydratase PrpD
MKTEERLIDFVCKAKFEDFPEEVLETVKSQFLAIAGTIVAGAAEDGCEEAVRFYKELGGKEEATILVHGGKIPAHDAAFVNGVMARALDLCDSIAPGPHIGAALITGALAAAELTSGIDGKDFLTSITVGNEVAARLNLTEEAYNGFDPTGICVIFGVAAAVSRIMGLKPGQVWNALALAFNRCGGSFQSHIDGSLGVRFVQGWVAQGGVISARLASKGITGPKNFLDGIYGYLHLYGKDLFDGSRITSALGEHWVLTNMVYKKYPSCALTQGPTDVILRLMSEENLTAGDIDRILVIVPPYTHKLVGHEFEIGENPRVNAQFNIRYCVANALIRGSARLEHFEESLVRDGKVAEFTKKIVVTQDKSLEERGHTPMDMRVRTHDGREFLRQLDIGPGFPGNPLTREDHEKRFHDCLGFAKKPINREGATEVAAMIKNLEKVGDVRQFVQLLLI